MATVTLSRKALKLGRARVSLANDWDDLVTLVNALKTLANELRTSHALLKTELDDIKAKYEDHRHSVAGAAATGTKPSTAGATADATASTIAQNVTSLTSAAVDTLALQN